MKTTSLTSNLWDTLVIKARLILKPHPCTQPGNNELWLDPTGASDCGGGLMSGWEAQLIVWVGGSGL